jgi:hypothetical protein
VDHNRIRGFISVRRPAGREWPTFRRPSADPDNLQPRPIKRAAVLGPIMAEPFGRLRGRGQPRQALRATAERCGGRDDRMLAARVEPKNELKKRKRFKSIELAPYQCFAQLLPKCRSPTDSADEKIKYRSGNLEQGNVICVVMTAGHSRLPGAPYRRALMGVAALAVTPIHSLTLSAVINQETPYVGLRDEPKRVFQMIKSTRGGTGR